MWINFAVTLSEFAIRQKLLMTCVSNIVTDTAQPLLRSIGYFPDKGTILQEFSFFYGNFSFIPLEHVWMEHYENKVADLLMPSFNYGCFWIK